MRHNEALSVMDSVFKGRIVHWAIGIVPRANRIPKLTLHPENLKIPDPRLCGLQVPRRYTFYELESVERNPFEDFAVEGKVSWCKRLRTRFPLKRERSPLPT